MPKRVLKTRLAAQQQGRDSITGAPLAQPGSRFNPALVDTDRRQPKAAGGTYDDEANVRILHPTTHARRHGALRDRGPDMAALKAIYDDRRQILKLLLKVENQVLAYRREVDEAPRPSSVAFLTMERDAIVRHLKQIDAEVVARTLALPDPLTHVCLAVPGIGPMTAAALAVYIDFEKRVCAACHRSLDDPDCPHGAPEGPGDPPIKPSILAASTISSLWKYAGLDTASHTRYEKGRKGGGNKTVRCALWNAACAAVKMGDRSAYRLVYDRVKTRLASSEVITTSRNTAGHLIQVAWKDTKPSHRHGAALRAVMKTMLADYWLVGRELRGMETRPLYVEEKLGHEHIARPDERGWKWRQGEGDILIAQARKRAETALRKVEAANAAVIAKAQEASRQRVEEQGALADMDEEEYIQSILSEA